MTTSLTPSRIGPALAMDRDELLDIAKEDERVKKATESYSRVRDLYRRSMEAMGRISKFESSVTDTEDTKINHEQSGSPEVSID